jgi:hypothetical protein
MEALPTIASKSVTEVVKKAESGKPVKPATVAAIVAKNTAKTVGVKPNLAKAVQANKEMSYGGYGSGYGAYNRPSYGRPQQRWTPTTANGRSRRRIIRPRYCVY